MNKGPKKVCVFGQHQDVSRWQMGSKGKKRMYADFLSFVLPKIAYLPSSMF
jgi:hypothetical protein